MSKCGPQFQFSRGFSYFFKEIQPVIPFGFYYFLLQELMEKWNRGGNPATVLGL
jgi:hypothetical protein